MKNKAYMLCLTATLILSFGCSEQPATVDEPKSYTQDGLSFDYPGNWRVTEDNQEKGVRDLSIETPGNALMIIQIYSEDCAVEILEFAKLFARATKKSAPIGNISDSEYDSVSEFSGYEELTERLTVTMLGQQLPYTREYWMKSFSERVCYIIASVTDEEQSLVAEGFDLVVSSLEYTP